MKHEELASDDAAINFDRTKYGVNSSTFASRAWKVTDDQNIANEVEKRTDACWVDWDGRAHQPEADLSYTGKQGRPSSLMSTSLTPKDRHAWKVPNSMREVEPSVNLVLDLDAAKVPNGSFAAKPVQPNPTPSNSTGNTIPQSKEGDPT